MEEKIKVSIPESIYNILVKDAKDFLITHEDGGYNFNLFLNKLITNYYQTFSLADEEIRNEIAKYLPKMKTDERSMTISQILLTIEKHQNLNLKKEKKVIIAFKPTKLSLDAISYINNHLIVDESLASYYRRLFISYSLKSQNEREKIIFKPTLELIEKAITKHKQVHLFLTSKANYDSCSLYALAASKDELFNYVLLEINQKPFTLRLAKIERLLILNTEAKFEDMNVRGFEKAIKYGPQYTIWPDESEPVKIRLTKEGLKLYQRIYLYRPEYSEVNDGDIYTFLGPYNQIIQYFRRFGQEAIVLSPLAVKNKLSGFYRFAYKAYIHN